MSIKDLEKLAREFIIGYAPLTEKQQSLIISIKAAEQARDKLLLRAKRYDRVIQAMYRKLAE
jgi:hypothetical protein